MTKQELNRDIKRLWKRNLEAIETSYNHDYEEKISDIKKEWLRLWGADPEAEYMNVESLKAMLRMNGRHRFKALHSLDIYFNPFK